MQTEQSFDNLTPEQLAEIAKLGEQIEQIMQEKGISGLDEYESYDDEQIQGATTTSIEPGMHPDAKAVAIALVEHLLDKGSLIQKEAADVIGIEFEPPEPVAKYFKSAPLPSASIEQIEQWAKHTNPYVRVELAKRGLAADILKNDAVAHVRYHVLKTTGEYSEHYRKRERSPIVIKEFIRQGIDRTFWKELHPDLANVVLHYEHVDVLIEQIETGHRTQFEQASELLRQLIALPDQQHNRDFINLATTYLNDIFDNNGPDMNTPSLEEQFEQEKCKQEP